MNCARLTPLLASAAIVAVGGHSARAVNLHSFTNPQSVVPGGTIGFTYAGDKFVGSVQRDGTGGLYQTDLDGGNVQVFAPTANLAPTNSSEHYLASSLGLGGFTGRDIYAASANGVKHITHDGSSSDDFVGGLNGSVRGILFDSIGTFNGDMIVTTAAGGVYRVNSAGTPTLIASTGEDTEGLDIAPMGAGFGGFDGQLMVASENSGLLRAINGSGVMTVVNPNNPVASAEELSFVPLTLGQSGNPVEGFYGADYTPDIVKGDSSEFAGMQGDIILTGETTHLLNRVHWNGTSFQYSVIGQFPNQPEDGIFVTAGLVNPTVPEPGTFALLGTGLLGIAPFLRRRR